MTRAFFDRRWPVRWLLEHIGSKGFAELTAAGMKLSELLGERVWRESGLGAAANAEQLKSRITALEQQVIDLTSQLGERVEELLAAGAGQDDDAARGEGDAGEGEDGPPVLGNPSVTLGQTGPASCEVR
ncbi:hypothetical protein ACFYZB_34330 [Streptomyces sp. NPDC001852]|uniref:hypothetical protein n=1 Tax=Streptomyces sp. NPDC001852 TaxID=3364619 RepID=UPI00367844CD